MTHQLTFKILLVSLILISSVASAKDRYFDTWKPNDTLNLTLDPAPLGNVILPDQTANRVLILDGSNNLVSSSTTDTVLGYLDIGSSLQGLLDAKTDESNTITTTAPLTIDGGASADLSASRTLAIPAATASVDGYLDNADFATFNGKQDSLPLTTKGDILVYNGTNYVRVPVGADGLVLSADDAEASGVKWKTEAASTGKNCQTKKLASDVTTTTADITALKFTGITIGKSYELKGQADILNANGTDALIRINHNSVIISETAAGNNETVTDFEYRIPILTETFVAAATTVIASSVVGAASSIRGDGTLGETWVQLCELPNNITIETGW